MERIIPIEQRGFALHADGCPMKEREWRGKYYANVIDDCTGCEHLVRIGDENGFAEYIVCAGFEEG